MTWTGLRSLVLLVGYALACPPPAPAASLFRFAILGDRTGEAQPGVYEQALREIAAAKPDFLIATGDFIQGTSDATAPAEWDAFERLLQPYIQRPFYPVPGNHDIWSAASERLYQQRTGKPLHYGFDYGAAHFTVLDDSRTDALSSEELAFLEDDLKAHAGQPVKFVISHRPSWILNAALQNPDFGLHRLARKYGVQYVVAGHLHQLLRFNLEDVTYFSMPSTGGHLRASEQYRDGWFFGYALVTVDGASVRIDIHELKAPHGQGRVTRLSDWGILGLVNAPPVAPGPAESRPGSGKKLPRD